MSPLEQLPNVYRAFFGKFPALTVAQKALIQPILNGRDVILQAGTGLGKTEAVLAPAIERLMTDPHPFTIIYIVPTRALALDMNRRIKPILKQLGLKSGIRTGDGKTLKDGQPNLLILTPESLDVLLGSQNRDNRYFLKYLRILIIDEVHIFLRDERGSQLSYLRRRLEMQATGELQILALSATISRFEEISSFFHLKDVFYYQQEGVRRIEPCWVHLENEQRELVPFFNDLFLRWNCKKLLVFANSRKKCEQLCELLKQEGEFSENVLLHYSNLSTKERRFIESSFRDHKKSVCVATSTLEMGIDIGDVDGVVLMGPPPSTMAFLQRIGRGNRRQQYLRCWGVCSGFEAESQLIRFLALFELAKKHQVEQIPLTQHHSVLFQQILSILYAQKVVVKDFLSSFFKIKDLPALIGDMVEKNWLQLMPQPGLFVGGWRYRWALKNYQIWSNFPPTSEEYEVILDNKTIADLPLMAVKQLEIGDVFQLTGKVLKLLKIEEKKAFRGVWVEESYEMITKELFWCGSGMLTPFEVAQQMGELLLDHSEPQGLLNRTRRLLDKARKRLKKSNPVANSMRVHQLQNGVYRYETFLGSVGNLILYRIIKTHYAKVEGFFVDFDELGIESNVWIRFEALTLPDSLASFQQWVSSHLSLLRQSFSWNSWFYSLPENLQKQEISSNLFDSRVLEYFVRYQKELLPSIPPEYVEDEDTQSKAVSIHLKGQPWSLEDEKRLWESIPFPDIPLTSREENPALTATQLQGYVTQRACPRWARFQHLRFHVETYIRFRENDLGSKKRRQEDVNFKQKIIDELRESQHVREETTTFNLEKAIQEVVLHQKPLFLFECKLEMDLPLSLKGRPDLIYLKHEGSHICLEIWDIKNGYAFTYAQKWRIAFYAYLLGLTLKEQTFSLPVRLSELGGLICRSTDPERSFERTPFLLTPFTSWMPRLIAQWKTDSIKHSPEYSLNDTCTSCRYFSYCYQETLVKPSEPMDPLTIVLLSDESNDFPKNTKTWFFISYGQESIRWELWQKQEAISHTHIYASEYTNRSIFYEAVVKQLQQQWRLAVERGEYPHILVYEQEEWHEFQKIFEMTPLKVIWSTHVCWTSIQSVLQKHFLWPIQGRVTATQVARCLGLIVNPVPPLSLYHREESLKVSCELFRQIWIWCLSQVKSQRIIGTSDSHKTISVPLIQTYLSIQRREWECRAYEILEFQKKPLNICVENFRAIGPMKFLKATSNGRKQNYFFSIDSDAPISKFRSGDLLKLFPAESSRIQEGISVSLESYAPESGILSICTLSEKIFLNYKQLYALAESATDWNAPKLETVLNRLKDPKFRPELIHMLHGHGKSFSESYAKWIDHWYDAHARVMQLNNRQKQALKLPFLKNIGLIEGPPGTGKTHLLVWTLMVLLSHAKALNRTIRILVTAQTHQAIDQILVKLAKIAQTQHLDEISWWKCGRYDPEKFSKLGIQSLNDSKPLMQNSSLVLGATGFGIYQLLEGKNFPQVFDWVIFDESSQVLPAYALLSLIFGKGNALFYGDTQQLPPIVSGNYKTASVTPRSILEELLACHSHQNRVCLNETYRMNDPICQFVSRHWYEGQLVSAVPLENQRLHLSNYPLFNDLLDQQLDPSKAMTVIEVDHINNGQASYEEALWIAKAVKRLIEDYAVSFEEIGIISPHRMQNNTLACALKAVFLSSAKLPKIDTVERMQGQEFDMVIFSATVSNQETIHSAFLKDYHRFNVALTRARKKFLFVASPLFFQSFPMTEKQLVAQFPFEDFAQNLS
jgi:superfamily II DNA/RNA helicase